ncbi:ABC-2 transporter permease [Marvinbryantia formatexigens]
MIAAVFAIMPSGRFSSMTMTHFSFCKSISDCLLFLCFSSVFGMAMPISNYAVVGSKYISIVCTLVPGVIGSIVLNLISSFIYGHWDLTLYVLSMAMSVLIPAFWAAICLLLTYWFGFRSAQMMSILCIFPIFYMVKMLEDETGWKALPDTMTPYVLIFCVICAVLFVFSYFLSVVGYSRKE